MSRFKYDPNSFDLGINHITPQSEPDSIFNPADWKVQEVLERREKAKQGLYPSSRKGVWVKVRL